MSIRPFPDVEEYWPPSLSQQRPLRPPPAPRIPYASLPPVTNHEPHLNPILVPRQGLVYNVRESPLTARVVSAEVTGRWNDQAATVPSVASMVIKCTWFEDPVVVLPMIATSGKVTVLDVLFAVHKHAHRVPYDPSTFSLLEPVVYRRGGERVRRGFAPIEASDGGGVVGTNAVAAAGACGSGGRGHVDGRRGVSVSEHEWNWVGIMPSAVEVGVWDLELR